MTLFRAECGECSPQPNAPDEIDHWRDANTYREKFKAGAQAAASRHNEKKAHSSGGAEVVEVDDE